MNRRKIEDDGNDVEEFKVFQCEGAGVKSSSESFHMINDICVSVTILIFLASNITYNFLTFL